MCHIMLMSARLRKHQIKGDKSRLFQACAWEIIKLKILKLTNLMKILPASATGGSITEGLPVVPVCRHQDGGCGSRGAVCGGWDSARRPHRTSGGGQGTQTGLCHPNLLVEMADSRTWSSGVRLRCRAPPLLQKRRPNAVFFVCLFSPGNMGALQSSPGQRLYADLAEKTGCECRSWVRARACVFQSSCVYFFYWHICWEVWKPEMWFYFSLLLKGKSANI